MSPKEKLGGNYKLGQVMIDFSNFVCNSGLIDVNASNSIFTWNNMTRDFLNIVERLDRFFVLTNWMDNVRMVGARIVPVSVSDHFSVELKIHEDKGNIKTCFKFENMWWWDKLVNLLEVWWMECRVGGSCSFKFMKKLQ